MGIQPKQCREGTMQRSQSGVWLQSMGRSWDILSENLLGKRRWADVYFDALRWQKRQNQLLSFAHPCFLVWFPPLWLRVFQSIFLLEINFNGFSPAQLGSPCWSVSFSRLLGRLVCWSPFKHVGRGLGLKLCFGLLPLSLFKTGVREFKVCWVLSVTQLEVSSLSDQWGLLKTALLDIHKTKDICG